MSCWVVPSLAAEYWGISVDQVMQKLDCGELTAREEHGFTLIDVAPSGPRQNTPKPMTYPTAPPRPMHESQLPKVMEQLDEIERDTFGDFRVARAQTALSRKAPRLMN